MLESEGEDEEDGDVARGKSRGGLTQKDIQDALFPSDNFKSYIEPRRKGKLQRQLSILQNQKIPIIEQQSAF